MWAEKNKIQWQVAFQEFNLTFYKVYLKKYWGRENYLLNVL